ncbi:hypothetical protein [Cytobacillus purgationiresistens]|uniref:Uncharacterized protein n=1 Tax=Cytobacillus purgationiresistens TaxID=863449 RepID=A0ABU0AFJ5_9BACI|nr:hypothetical protein [Cytobacillus purgationiresistens]MDQ0269790.1 hypothetical protein [Cytobacillus purgationiresistens]
MTSIRHNGTEGLPIIFTQTEASFIILENNKTAGVAALHYV